MVYKICNELGRKFVPKRFVKKENFSELILNLENINNNFFHSASGLLLHIHPTREWIDFSILMLFTCVEFCGLIWTFLRNTLGLAGI